MFNLILDGFTGYLVSNWASVLSWSLIIIALCIVKIYQVKWKKAKNQLLQAQNQQVKILTNIDKVQIQQLRDQCDILKELYESANERLVLNNQNVDREVLELIQKMSVHSQGIMKNVD